MSEALRYPIVTGQPMNECLKFEMPARDESTGAWMDEIVTRIDMYNNEDVNSDNLTPCTDFMYALANFLDAFRHFDSDQEGTN